MENSEQRERNNNDFFLNFEQCALIVPCFKNLSIPATEPAGFNCFCGKSVDTPTTSLLMYADTNYVALREL